MRRIMIAFIIGIALSSPVYGQQLEPSQEKSTLNRQDQPPVDDRAALMMSLMENKLPYLNGQRLHYRDDDGKEIAYAVRKGSVIKFYDKDSNYLGEAIRRTQMMTEYFDADSNLLGSKTFAQMTAKKGATLASPTRGRPESDD